MSKAWIQILVVTVFLSLAAPALSADLDISELIKALKKAISEAQKTATQPHVNIPWAEAEISYTVKKEGGGGFKLYVVTADAKYAKETVHRFKFRLEPPDKKPWIVKAPGEYENVVVSGVDLNALKIFVSPEGESAKEVFPLYINPATKITDTAGEKKTLSDIREGMEGKIQFVPGPKGETTAAHIILENTGKNK